MRWSIDRKIAGTFSVALLSVALLSALACTSMTTFLKSTRWAAHAQVLLAELDDVPQQLELTERAQLQYLLTGDESYRATYKATANGVVKELDDVQHLTKDNPVQRDRVTTLTGLTKVRLAKLQEATTAQDANGNDAAVDTLLTSGSTVTKEDIQAVLQDMEREGKEQFAQHEAAAMASARSIRRLTVSTGIVSFLLVAFAGVLLNRDVLRRRRAEAALQESETRYRTLVENTNEGMIAMTPEGTISAINHGLEAMLDWSREELMGESYGKILTSTSASQSEERLRHALAVERLPSVYEAESVRKDGSIVPVEVRADFLRDGTGHITGLLALHRDISIRKALEQSRLARSPDLHRQPASH